jgi:hypothetical protein
MIGKQTNKSLIHIMGNANWTNVLKSERMIFLRCSWNCLMKHDNKWDINIEMVFNIIRFAYKSPRDSMRNHNFVGLPPTNWDLNDRE